MFYKNIAHVLQTVTVFVLCSCLRRCLPFEDGGGSELLLAYLTSVMRDHLTRLAGDRSDLGICGTGLQQEHDGRLAQSMKDTTALPQELHLWASELMGPGVAKSVARPRNSARARENCDARALDGGE